MTPRPPIVFIAALGWPGQVWRPVVDRLDDLTTVTYDRPGIGSAPPRPAPNPPLPYSALADELATLLDQRRVLEPAVIVGHSVGSLIARVYAGRHPDRVAGMVHVDGSIPQFHLYPGMESAVDGDADGGTELDILTGQVEVLTARPPAVPTLVLTRTPGRWAQATPPAGADELWLVSQRILAQDSGAALVVADDSGHHVPVEAPDLVAFAVRAVLGAAVSGGRVDLGGLGKAGGHLG